MEGGRVSALGCLVNDSERRFVKSGVSGGGIVLITECIPFIF